MSKDLITVKKLLAAVIIMAMLITATVDMLAYANNMTSTSNTGYEKDDFVKEGDILSFENQNPVYAIQAYRNTEFEDLGLPDSLRVVMPVSADEKANFTQILPQKDTTGEYAFLSYGYIQDENAQEKYEKGNPVLYTIFYADGSKAYRVYGNLGDGVNRFFACDENGEITGQIGNIEVEWKKAQYNSKKYDSEQRLTPFFSERLYYTGDVYAEVVVCDADEPTHAEEDIASVQSGEPIAALKKTGARNVNNQNLTPYQQAQNAIKQYTPTRGNKPGTDSFSTGVPGTWVDYINTIWRHKTGIDGTETVFQFKNSGLPDAWKWNGQKATKTTGDPATDPMVIPTNRGDGQTYGGTFIYDVYSASQLRWTLEKVQDLINQTTQYNPPRVTINIKRDIDLNGIKYNWNPTNYFGKLTINGEGHTLYNLLSYQPNTGKSTDAGIRGSFLNFYSKAQSNDLTRYCVFNFNNITFEAAYCVCFNLAGGGLFGSYNKQKGDWKNKEGVTMLSKVRILNSLFYNGSRTYLSSNSTSGYISPFGNFAGGPYKEERGTIKKNKHKTRFDDCYVSGCYVYGHNHVCGFFSRAQHGVEMNKCFTEDTILCGTGGHSAGIISCQSSDSKCYDSFANINMYSSKIAGGFTGTMGGYYERCFTTGKLEGYSEIGGFAGRTELPADGTTLSEIKFTDCYSTMLVGMRSASSNIGGFLANGYAPDKPHILTNCYAAGEVGDYSTDSTARNNKNNKNAGGFAYATSNKFEAKNCYYDKQTTAMREWVRANVNIERGGNLPGVTGVLTRTTAKAGTGLTAQPSTASSKGFKGFTDNSKWVFVDGKYPQLKSLNQPTSAWGDEVKNLIKANSIASVSTVFLDTWDTGYDWNKKGVRSENEVPYARTKSNAFTQSGKSGYNNHVGYEYTYDTVREVISDFTATPENSDFKLMVGASGTSAEGSGAKTELIDSASGSGMLRKAISVNNETRKGTVHHSGVEWFSITSSSSNKKAMRPLRLVSFMKVEAGDDKHLAVNELYDHTHDAKFTMMEKIVDDRIVGIDDEKKWAEAVRQGYPASKKYYEAVTDKTSFGASEDAWVYTEIWLVEENGKTLTKPKSVRITGSGTNISGQRTPTEKQWIGELPIGSGLHAGMKFKITYYWMLSDGRYRSDSKYVDLKPGAYDLHEYVYNENGTQNDKALYLGTQQGKDAKVNSNTTRAYAELLKNAEGTPVLAAWEKNPKEDLDVTKLKLKFSRANLAVSDVPELKNPKVGDKITITATYYGYEEKTEKDAPGGNYDRITLAYQPVPVKITYTVEEKIIDGKRINYLLFDHEATISQNNFSLAEGEVAEPDLSNFAKLNLLMKAIDADIDVVLIVSSRCNLKITKTKGVDGESTGDPLKGVGFCLYRMDSQTAEIPQVTCAELINGKKGRIADDTYLDKQRTQKLSEAGALTGNDGILSIYGMTSGHYYYLVETKPLGGYASPKQMIRFYIDPNFGIVTMQKLDLNGNAIGAVSKFRYSDGPETEGTILLDSGDFINVSILNEEHIVMPETGGTGTLMFAGFSLLSAAAAVVCLYRRRREKAEK